MSNSNNVKLQTKQYILLGICLVGFVIFGAFAYQTLNTVKVNGPLYKEIAQDKDLIADVLPPPEYIIEADLVTFQMATETDKVALEDLVRRSRTLKEDYETRHAFWANTLPEGPLRQVMIDTSYRSAMEFFEVRDREFIPAVLKGDRAKAKALAEGILKQKYDEHRRAIDQVVKLATEKSKANEERAASLIRARASSMILLVVAIIIILSLIARYWIIRPISWSLRRVDGELRTLVAGDADLTRRIPIRGNDEVENLASSVNDLMQKLSTLVKRVQESGILVTSSATQIAASSKQLEATMAEQVASSNEVVSAVKEISGTAKELSTTMNEVTDMSEKTAISARSGRIGLGRMETSIGQMEEASKSISDKLAVINDKASNITTVVTTINKVADQTNLLSLNAAIEAEKAGEFGLGFGVVAREIRRLADQTALATLDIEKMVKEMRSAVSAGVMSMDKFSEQVRQSAHEVRNASEQLGEIIEAVQALTPRFEKVNEGMHSQMEGAEHISEAMIQLGEATRQTADSLRESNQAIQQLNEAARALQKEFALFRVA